jgi:hypothetical protein
VNHRDVRDRLGDYLEGALALPDRALVDAHLDECDACLCELGELRTTVRMLRALSAVDEPADVTAVVMRRIAEGEAQPTWWQRFVDVVDVWARPRALAAVAVGATALAGVLIFEPDMLRGGSPELRAVQPGSGLAARPPVANDRRLLGTGRFEPDPVVETVGQSVRVLAPPRLEGLPPHIELRLLRGDPMLQARSLQELFARGIAQPRVYSSADLYGELMHRRQPLPEPELAPPPQTFQLPLQSTPVSYPAQ